MIDFHCHLDLYSNPIEVYEEAKKKKSKILVVTTSPRAYLKTSQVFCESDLIQVAMGLHPEILTRKINEIELFIESISKCRYLGEVGIDGNGENRNTVQIQEKFFMDVLEEAERQKGKILSIHSRGASSKVLRIIEKTLDRNTVVLHWFTGNTKELEWAISLGCIFSINPNMCITNSGREIIKKIPLDRILPETDGPFTQKNGIPYMPWDTTVINYLAREYGMSEADINNIMENNLLSI